MYNQSLKFVDFTDENKRDVSIIFANRSAVLYHLEYYEEAIEDIRIALNFEYPKNISYKVKERKSKCLLALKQHKSALESFKQALSSLDDAKIPIEKKRKMQLDIQIMISMLGKQKNLRDEPINKFEKPIKTFSKSNKKMPSLIHKIDIESSRAEGRFAKAVEDIPVGTNILVEDPYTSVLLEQYTKSHCYHCLKSVRVTLYPCTTCSKVIFCSVKCQEKANLSHHGIECSVLPFLWKSGLSVICYLSLRIITQNKEDYFQAIKKYFETMDKNTTVNCLSQNQQNYLKTHSLVTHSDKRSLNDYLHTTHVAIFLYQLLKASNYFKTNDQNFEDFIGGLLLHQIQLLQYNSHEVADLINESGKSKTRFIGAALYPTLALFNHSCEPNLVRYFKGNKVYVNLCKNIKKGDKIYENYGPLYSQEITKERQKTLKTQYCFDCNCIACENDWPSFEIMDKSKDLRFKCETENCKNLITIPLDTTQFMIKCNICDKFINIFKGLKNLQDSESLFRLAENYQLNGEFDKALEKFIELMNLMDQNLIPPYRDYVLCQRALQTCFLNMGEKSDDTKSKTTR